jgi:hypothetical protein
MGDLGELAVIGRERQLYAYLNVVARHRSAPRTLVRELDPLEAANQNVTDRSALDSQSPT